MDKEVKAAILKFFRLAEIWMGHKVISMKDYDEQPNTERTT